MGSGKIPGLDCRNLTNLFHPLLDIQAVARRRLHAPVRSGRATMWRESAGEVLVLFGAHAADEAIWPRVQQRIDHFVLARRQFPVPTAVPEPRLRQRRVPSPRTSARRQHVIGR